MIEGHSLFIADLHLDPARPARTSLACRFLDDAAGCHALYIVGDLFEYWLGDDATDPRLKPFIDRLAHLARSGTALTFMHGNRDFLLGHHFAERVGGRVETADEMQLTLGEETILLMHGDTLCTDDVDYQKLRALLRSEEWQKPFLQLSLENRIKAAEELRARSRSAVALKSSMTDGVMEGGIMDVNAACVEQRLSATGCTTLLHGHTHRPDTHEIKVNDSPRRRLVLGDWHDDHAVFAVFDGTRLQLHTYR